VRENRDGILVAANYGEVAAAALDPIEKKPLYHFYPGSFIFSAGSRGCNLRCRFCQNWELAHGDPPARFFEAAELVDLAMEDPRSLGIAFTYNEPLVWYEYLLDCLPLARDKGLKTVLVSNGFIEEEPLKPLLELVDAWNIDLKGFSARYYHKILGGHLKPVLNTLELVAAGPGHLEVTTLLVPGLNDSLAEIEELVTWVAQNLGPDTPLHFSRYFPRYRLDLPPTPAPTMQAAYELGRAQLHYVYLGNINQGRTTDTFCPRCGETVIHRRGYGADTSKLKENRCAFCGERLAIIN